MTAHIPPPVILGGFTGGGEGGDKRWGCHTHSSHLRCTRAGAKKTIIICCRNCTALWATTSEAILGITAALSANWGACVSRLRYVCAHVVLVQTRTSTECIDFVGT